MCVCVSVFSSVYHWTGHWTYWGPAVIVRYRWLKVSLWLDQSQPRPNVPSLVSAQNVQVDFVSRSSPGVNMCLCVSFICVFCDVCVVSFHWSNVNN